ncbi:MAG: cupredoxin domain-containing protein [Cryobacterium sp.]|nr:cupredoxin domain-containing protein [Oligoflexia bacterium]
MKLSKVVNAAIFLSFIFFTTGAQAKQIEVQMKSISYSPKLIAIHSGDSVVWKNVSYSEHSASGETFDTSSVEPKHKSKAILFEKPGTYTYHCKVHGTTMNGTIKVESK